MSEMSAYESENIIVVEGLEAVRKRPGMYVGGTDQQALNHLGIELIDNAIDESGVFHQVSPMKNF